MIRQEDIASLTIDGVEYSAFRLGTKDGGMPNHLFQGEKQDGMVIRNGKVEKWTWNSIHYEGNDRYVYFDRMDLHSLEEIATTKREHALEIVMNIARGLHQADREWLDLETGVFPLYRIFIVGESDVLLLPPDIGTVVGLLRTPEQRRDEVNALIKKGNEETFLLIAEMVQLLYFALTGFLPYIEEQVRHWKYREFPLDEAMKILGEDIDQKTLGFINFVLHAKTRQMRDIGGNRLSSQALAWFIKNASCLEWSAKDRDAVESPVNTPEWREWTEKTEKGARKNTFWRKRGTVITVCSVIGAVLIWLVGSWIARALAPPVTKDCTQEEIVYAVYEAQNSLNPELLDTAVKGTSLPQDMDVINLFVNSRVRGAYEMASPIHDPNDWLAEGSPALAQGDLIYGVTDVELERIDDSTIVASAVWYGPHYSDEPEENYDPTKAPESIAIEITPIDQTFRFEWNDRGWWNIVYSDVAETGESVVIDVPLIPAPIMQPQAK